MDQENRAGQTALHEACAAGRGDTAVVLLDWGAVVDKANRDGLTALALAAAEGRASVVAVLLEKVLCPCFFAS